jgi:hypothetical protein
MFAVKKSGVLQGAQLEQDVALFSSIRQTKEKHSSLFSDKDRILYNNDCTKGLWQIGL